MSVTTLLGRPVFVCRPGVYPNKSDVLSIMASWPNAVIRTETLRSDDTNNCTRFVVTVREFH